MSPIPHLRLVDFTLDLTTCHTHQPFRFGIHTLTQAELAQARGLVEFSDGSRTWGQASDLLVPKWFEKDPDKSPADDTAALVESIKAAAAAAAQADTFETAFEYWQRLHTLRVCSAERSAGDLLVRGFGVALLERLVLDAVARQADLPFHTALAKDIYGFAPGRIHPELADWRVDHTLPKQPAHSITLRHTVGLLDPLRPSAPSASSPPDAADQSEKPLSLQEHIQRHGLTHFKIKVAGPEGLERLLEVAQVLRECVPAGARFTLDGNEQFSDLGQLADLLQRVHDAPGGADFLKGLLFIEQPLSRTQTFAAEAHAELTAVTAHAPLLIDEADLDTWSFPEAVALGYGGVSVKACKGVFRALLNAGICHTRGGGLFQSGEDLTNLPLIALHQDLCLMSALGIEHLERNGHHYFRGLDHLPQSAIAYALDAHADLYARDGRSAHLTIQDGRLNIASLQCPGFGADLLP
ncbi:MAG: enolase C-terminal domain-like protein [Planctomycetota bacterium]|jgi:hypothetical protein|nr:hypothetical protein [Planctomycetota bacterium]MDP6839025.1 enolase C-terminal domain-like protein [Planctomycetota bacterium]MDP6955986.1 enolase C-terminal domain-like protein [Planctomycetota bacterium]